MTALSDPSTGGLSTLHQIVERARANLSSEIWNYLIGGSDTETTLRRNRAALDSYAFVPRVLRDVSNVDVSSEFLGHPTALPVVLGPVGSLASFWEDGGAATARAAKESGVPLFVSSAIEGSLENIAASSSGLKTFQIFARGDAAWLHDTVARAADAGYDALCVTVDTALPARRERDIASGFEKPWAKAARGKEFQAALDWSGLEEIAKASALKLIVKGISSPQDAARISDLGAAAVYISNHGGRQLDHAVGTVEMLPEIVSAVAGRTKVIVDGGISRGTDVVKAMALGADAVAIGRLYLYGLAAAGEAGIVRVLDILQQEVRLTLGLLGFTSFAEIDASCLRPAAPLVPPHVLSPFPLLPPIAD